MVLQVSSANNVRVYTVSGSNLSRKIPDWLVRRKKRELKKDLEWQTRIELIQDFEFPEASNRVKVTPDGESIMATGVYKPQIRVFECSQLAMKFDRHTDTENINFLILSDDWTKSVHLQADRSIEFHNQGQMHYRARIPKFGRDLCYHYPSCDLLIVGASAEVYRLNLDQGRFLKPLETSSSSGINVCSVNPAHQLWGFGLQDGGVEFWDPRTRSRVGLIEPTVAGLLDMVPGTRAGMEVTALEYRRDGLGLAVGTSSGHTLLYDLRQARPRVVKDQQYGLPIKRIRWIEPHSSSADVGTDTATVLSADAKIIKLWDADNGRALTSIEPPNDINDVTVYPDSGLLMVANEGIEIHSFYIPKLGPAPRWASFLENISEEMEENPQQNIYDDYRFVTRRELEALSLDHLVGTNLLKPYMHGFFVDYRLYERAKAIANPFAYEEYRMQAVKAKIEKDRASRIRATTKLPKVNRALAQRLLAEERKQQMQASKATDVPENSAAEKPKAKKKSFAADILYDDRFKGLFENPEFEVDENTIEYKLLHPTKSKKQQDLERQRAQYDSDDSSQDDQAPVDRMDGNEDGDVMAEPDSDTDSDEEFYH